MEPSLMMKPSHIRTNFAMTLILSQIFLSQLADFSKVTKVYLSTDAIHHLAERNPFGLGSKRAFVAPVDLLYGLVRMFQILTDNHPDELTVFRDIHEARKYLSL